MSNSKQKLLIDKIIELDKKLIEKIKENYYFIVLSSFSLVLATFSKETVPNAFIYAVSASSLFLFSFLMEFLRDLSEDSAYIAASVSLFSTISGFIFFLMIIFEFTRVIDPIPKIFQLIQQFAFTILILAFAIEFIIPICPSIKGVIKYRKDKNRKLLVEKAFIIFLFGILIFIGTILYLTNVIITSLSILNIQFLKKNLFIIFLEKAFSNYRFYYLSIFIILFVSFSELLIIKKIMKENYRKLISKIKEELQE